MCLAHGAEHVHIVQCTGHAPVRSVDFDGVRSLMYIVMMCMHGLVHVHCHDARRSEIKQTQLLVEGVKN